MADEPKLPNPDISLPERLLVLLFAGGLDFIKFAFGFIPLIDLFGIVIFFLGMTFVYMYFILRTGFKGLFGGSRRFGKIATSIALGIFGFIPFLENFVPELFIECLATFYFLAAENRAARPTMPRLRNQYPKIPLRPRREEV